MAALSATVPTLTGTASPGAGVASSDTIARSIMGPNGAILEILNGNASTDNVGISDASIASSGSPSTDPSTAIPTAQNRVFLIQPDQVDVNTGLVTITHSVTTTVTYKLYPI